MPLRPLATVALLGATLALPAAGTTAADTGTACAEQPTQRTAQDVAPRADDATIDLRRPGQHRGYLQLDDGEAGPPPAVGHWRTQVPRSGGLPSDPDHLLVAASPDLSASPPVFGGTVVGELRTLGLQIARGLVLDPPPQVALVVSVTVDDRTIFDGPVPVVVDQTRLDVCHLAHYGRYYAVLTDLAPALAEAGIENGDDTEHTVVVAFAPSGRGDGVPPFDVFGIDAQAAPSALEFNGGQTPGPRTSVLR